MEYDYDMVNYKPPKFNFQWKRVKLLIVLIIVLSVTYVLLSCTTNHYFSINAEEMTNPSIVYEDSTQLQKFW